MSDRYTRHALLVGARRLAAAAVNGAFTARRLVLLPVAGKAPYPEWIQKLYDLDRL